jgi:hypothetical protein
VGGDGTCQIAAKRRRTSVAIITTIAPCPRRDAGAVRWVGSDGAITSRIAANPRRPRRDAGATGHNARDRDTGERRAAWAAMGPSPAVSSRAFTQHRTEESPHYFRRVCEAALVARRSCALVGTLPGNLRRPEGKTRRAATSRHSGNQVFNHGASFKFTTSWRKLNSRKDEKLAILRA